MAARKNKKRDFLFVSKVIGKHLPMHPAALKIIGSILARLWLEEKEGIKSSEIDTLVSALKEISSVDLVEDTFSNSINKIQNSYSSTLEYALNIIQTPLTLKNKTLFIGFAETATGLAQSVFENFSNASYIHTTRENIKSISPNFIFKEEHSHAVNHLIYAPTKDYFKSFDEIVLVDDELTTGKTACNLIKNLPGENFGIISILDWRNEDNIKHIKAQKEYKKNILVASLLKGSISCNKKRDILSDSSILINTENTLHSKSVNLNTKIHIEGYTIFTGRFGIDSNYNRKIKKEIESIASTLKKEKIEGNCLCLGTGEFIYIPCMTASEMGEKVFYHSTTRSPIYPLNIKNYGARNKIQFTCPENNEITNYLYNIPSDFYSHVFLFTEKPLNHEKKKEFENIFSTFNIKKLIFVSFTQY